MRKYPLLFILLACIFSSCTQKINLAYEPVIERCEEKKGNLFLGSFEDGRQKLDVGSKRNVYGIPIVTLVTEDDVALWVTNALKLEMENAGYTITDQIQNEAYQFEGKVIRVYTTTYFIYHGRMTVEISVKREGSEVFRKIYTTKVSNGISFIASSASCSKTLALNLQQVCKQFISDFNLLDKS